MINTPCLRDNDLLLVKLFRLQQKFKFPKDFIKNNRKKTEWNLYRLYRVRNSIVHKWNIESLWLPIEKLTLDLEEYYTNLLEIILDRFSENDRFENIEQLFISFEKTYDFIQSEKWLSSTLDESEVKNKILNPILLF
jgi:hypothetical protein